MRFSNVPVAYKYPFPKAGDADAVTPPSAGWFTCSTTASERLSRCVQDGGRSIRPPATSIRSIKLFKSNQRLFLWPDGGSRSWGGEFRHFVLIIIGAGFSCLAIVRLKGNLLDIKLDCSFWFDWLDDVY